jgi:hypothetical protein
MSPQLESVYDYMIERGLKLKGHRVKRRDRLDYADNSIAELYIELSTKRGGLTAFLNHLVEQGVFSNFGYAKNTLRNYAQSVGYVQTHDKRMLIRSIYEKFEFNPMTKDVEKWNKKLQEVWESVA